MNNFRSALRAGATAILVAGVILACGDIPESVGPAALSLPTVVAMSQGDSVQWSNNVLEMVVDGDTIRWERDQQDATEVSVFVNGDLQLTFDLFRDSGIFVGTEVTDHVGGFRAAVDTAGTIISVMGTGCTPSHMDPECPEPEFQDPCTGLGYAFEAALTTALVAGVYYLATRTTPFAATTLNTFRASAIAAVTTGKAWWDCKQAHAGGDDCDEDDPEECRPEETR